MLDAIKAGRRAGDSASDHGASIGVAGKCQLYHGAATAPGGHSLCISKWLRSLCAQNPGGAVGSGHCRPAYGLPFEAALAAITIDAAKILGIEQQVGSIGRRQRCRSGAL